MVDDDPTFAWRGRTFGETHDPIVIADMAWAHDGLVQNALKIVDDVADAGADGITIHMTDLASYTVRGYGRGHSLVAAGNEPRHIFDHLGEIALAADALREVARHAQSRGLLLSTMCTDERSLELADDVGPDMHVLAPACVGDEHFTRSLAARGVPVVVTAGCCTLAEIESAIVICRAEGAPGVIIQYGPKAYPSSDLDFGYLATLRNSFRCPVGYHDHTAAALPAARYLPVVALGAGASVLEKHVAHDRALKGHDRDSAFVRDELAEFVSAVKTCAAALGAGRWRPLTDSEIRFRQTVRKRMVAARDLAAGVPLHPGSFAFKRSDRGLSASDAQYVQGRTLKHAKAADDPIEWQDV